MFKKITLKKLRHHLPFRIYVVFSKMKTLLKFAPYYLSKDLINQVKFIDGYYRFNGAKGEYKVKFTLGARSKGYLKTPWLPMLRVQLRSYFLLQEYLFDLKKNPIIIDAGANIGIASIYFSDTYSPKKLYSVEADRSLINKYLAPNLSEFNINAEIINKALWRKSGEIVKFETTGIDSGHISNEKIKSKENNVSVETLSLDDLLEEVGDCDLLKLDVEGAESEVIFSSKKLHLVRNIYVEVEYQRGSNKPYTKIIEYLEESGFEVFQRSTMVTDIPKEIINKDDIVFYVHIIGIRK